MGIDYYGVLSIKRNSTDLDIKKTYRRLALQFNPERLKCPNSLTVFTLICEAYDVLSNPLRKAVFDQYGEEGLKKGVPGPNGEYTQAYMYHGDPYRTYKEFFGTTSPYADLLDYLVNPIPLYNLPQGTGVRRKQETLYHPLELTLSEVYFGGLKKMRINRLIHDRLTGNTTQEGKILNVIFKPGVRPGTQIKFIEAGEQNPTQIPADVVFVTEDIPHEHFKRENEHLIFTSKISLQEALVGYTVTITTIDGRIIRVPITDVVTFGYEKVVPNEGLPILERPQEKGNLIIRFQIQFPEYLPAASKSFIRKAFKMAENDGNFGDSEMINRLILADKMRRVDPKEQLPPI